MGRIKPNLDIEDGRELIEHALYRAGFSCNITSRAHIWTHPDDEGVKYHLLKTKVVVYEKEGEGTKWYNLLSVDYKEFDLWSLGYDTI